MEKVCLVIGAGAGIGGTVAKKFANDIKKIIESKS